MEFPSVATIPMRRTVPSTCAAPIEEAFYAVTDAVFAPFGHATDLMTVLMEPMK
ncbi:unnamed protein product [Medioppia subpectinata]|uniref:Uncharacterized protein n=1 Tax=Medioppia subpectinata TaxID=1979941 RepID=A0A7R9LPW9_9ACAR|nr:unnamed protein product [Medioppia subpectinata]CAG2120626.1 unnamed protein product [Medioppia subpectinata]